MDPADRPHLARFFVFPPFIADSLSRTLFRDGRAVSLGSRAFDTLLTLIRNRERVVTKDDFLREAWHGAAVEDSNLSKQISTLRKVLDDTRDAHRFIVTVPGVGYRFAAPVEERETEAHLRMVPQVEEVRAWRQVSVGLAVSALVCAVLLGWLASRMLDARRMSAPAASRALWQLTFDPGVQTDPAWSPDGRTLAYSSDRSGQAHIWLQAVGGGAAVQLTHTPLPDVEPDWSPDGTRLAFATRGVGGGIRVIAASGGVVQPVASFGESPQWSPDGSSILFTRSDFGGSRLFVARLDGRDPAPILEEFLRPFRQMRFAWHPDSRHVSVWGVHRDAGIGFWTIRLDGTGEIRSAVSSVVTAQFERDALAFTDVYGTPSEFSWSSRGDALVFEGVSRGVHNLWRVSVDPQTLTWTQGPERLTTASDVSAKPQLSHDGSRLAFASRHERVRLWSFPFDSNAGRVLGEGEALTSDAFDALSPEVSRDGARLVYKVQRGEAGEVRVRDLHTGADTVLVKGDDRVRTVLRWAADGREVFYARNASVISDDVVSATMSGGLEQVVHSARNTLDYLFDWAPDGRWCVGVWRSPAGVSELRVVRSSASPLGDSVRTLAVGRDAMLRLARFSPDQRWVAFVEAKAGSSQVHVVDVDGGPTRVVTDGASYDDHPRWSADGKLLYFLSNRSGFFNLWSRRFDLVTGQPVGEPFQVTSFNLPSRAIPLRLRQLGISVAGDRLIVPVSEVASRIWILDDLDRH